MDAFTDLTLLDWGLLAAATLFVSETLTAKDGPGDVFKWLRENVPHIGLLTCTWCLTPWIALLLYLAYVVFPPVVYILAVAGLALMLRSYTGVQHG